MHQPPPKKKTKLVCFTERELKNQVTTMMRSSRHYEWIVFTVNVLDFVLFVLVMIDRLTKIANYTVVLNKGALSLWWIVTAKFKKCHIAEVW